MILLQIYSTSTPIHYGISTRAENSLKEWLEFQFRELHRKVDAIAETQVKLQSAFLKRKNKKVTVFIHSYTHACLYSSYSTACSAVTIMLDVH